MADLDSDRIARTALALADKHGLEGFTMRAVAKALKVTPMALYHHVQDKTELAKLMLDCAIREHPLPAPTGVWQEDMWAFARWMRESARAHPSLAIIRRTYRVWTPTMLQMSEAWMNLWRQTGLPPDRALLGASLSSVAIIGLVDEEAILRDLDQPADDLLKWLPNARLLLSTSIVGEDKFELAVRAVIEGMYARLARSDLPVPPVEPLQPGKPKAVKPAKRKTPKKGAPSLRSGSRQRPHRASRR